MNWTNGVLRMLPIASLLALALASGPALAQELPSVTGAQIGTSADVTVVRIALDGPAKPTVSPFRQTNPERLVLDIAGAKLQPSAAIAAAGMVSKVELGTFNDGTDNVRLTFFLSGPATWNISAEAGAILLTLTPGVVSDPLADALGAPTEPALKLSGPAVVTGSALTSLDFQQRERVSRVLIGARGTEPAVSQPKRNTIAVDLPGASMPESLRRELDSRFFYSAVDSVKAAPTASGTRVTIELREGAEYQVSKEGELLVLAIQIPADILTKRDAAYERASVENATPAAPSNPSTSGDKGLGNSIGQETLIDQSGRTLDPQARYGTGAGTTAPGSYSFVTEVKSTTSRSTARRMSIDLQEADIHVVFRFIADFADINIITSDEVAGKVTVRLKDVPWDEALGSVLQAKGLGAQQYGTILRVAPLETIKSEQQNMVEAEKAEFDLADLQLYVAPLNYAQADELLEQVTAVLTTRGSVQVDSRGNQLIVRDRAETIAQVRELLRTLDKPNRQVSIEARFVEASSNFERGLGIEWGNTLDASGTTGYPTGAFFPSSVGETLGVDLGLPSTTGFLDLTLGSIPGLINVSARIEALEAEGWGKVISSPRVTALDNEKATVVQGARIPYQASQGVANAASTTQFISANLELAVTPHITADGTVFLDISITNDRPDFSNQINGNPTIQTKSITTRVLVPDGDTAVLGGVYATTEAFAQNNVPFLSKIPILGWLFKNTLTSRDQNEMLVFITPRIIPLEKD